MNFHFFFIFLFLGYTTPAKLSAVPNRSGKITTTYIRIFPTPNGEQPEKRSNARWFDICHGIRNGVQFFVERKSHTFGYIGECELCNLAFVDRGASFMSDTLHTIYHGAFVRVYMIEHTCITKMYIFFLYIKKAITTMD